MSPLFKLNSHDALKGVVVSVFAAVLTSLYGVINDPEKVGVIFTSEFWLDVVRIGVTSGIAYILKNLMTNEEGKVLGKF